MIIIAVLMGLFVAKSNAVEPTVTLETSDIECQAKLENRPKREASPPPGAANND